MLTGVRICFVCECSDKKTKNKLIALTCWTHMQACARSVCPHNAIVIIPHQACSY